MNRKDFLKSLGALTAGATFLGTGETVKAAGKAMGVSVDNSLFTDPEVDFPVKGLKAGVKNGPVKVIIIGAGNRGRTYANYAKMFPDCMQIVGVSDIRESRKNAMGDRFNVPEEHRFGDWSEVFRVPKFADAVVISTPDDVHYDPCMKALEWGYDCLLEKPVAQTERECTDIAKQAHKYGRIPYPPNHPPYLVLFRLLLFQPFKQSLFGLFYVLCIRSIPQSPQVVNLLQPEQFACILTRLFQPGVRLTKFIFRTFTHKELGQYLLIQLIHSFLHYDNKTTLLAKTLTFPMKNRANIRFRYPSLSRSNFKALYM